MIKIGVLDGRNDTQDYQIAQGATSLAHPGVIEGLKVSDGVIGSGKAFIEVEKSNGEKFLLDIYMTENETFTTTPSKWVVITVDQAKLDDGINNNVDGTGIASIQLLDEVPEKNAIAIAKIHSDNGISDYRVFVQRNYVVKQDGKNISCKTPVGTKFRYIRDWAHGSNENDGSHYVEIQAIEKGTGTNVALGKVVTSSSIGTKDDLSLLVNGVISTSSSQYVALQDNTLGYMQIDLGGIYDLESIKVWHYYSDSRVYKKTKTEVSVDGINWYSIFDSDFEGTYAESSSGKTNYLMNPIESNSYLLNGNDINTAGGLVVLGEDGEIPSEYYSNTILTSGGDHEITGDWKFSGSMMSTEYTTENVYYVSPEGSGDMSGKDEQNCLNWNKGLGIREVPRQFNVRFWFVDGIFEMDSTYQELWLNGGKVMFAAINDKGAKILFKSFTYSTSYTFLPNIKCDNCHLYLHRMELESEGMQNDQKFPFADWARRGMFASHLYNGKSKIVLHDCKVTQNSLATFDAAHGLMEVDDSSTEYILGEAADSVFSLGRGQVSYTKGHGTTVTTGYEFFKNGSTVFGGNEGEIGRNVITNLVSKTGNIGGRMVANSNVSAGDPVRLGLGTFYKDYEHYGSEGFNYTSTRLGYTNTYSANGQSFVADGNRIMTRIDADMSKYGSPTGNLSCELLDGAGGNILATSTNTVEEDSLNEHTTNVTFNFNDYNLVEGEEYFIKISVDRGVDSSNHSAWNQSGSGNGVSEGKGYYVNSDGNWYTDNNYISQKGARVYTYTAESIGSIMKASYSNESQRSVIGFAKADGGTGSTINYATSGIVGNQVELVPGKDYYLNRRLTGIVSTNNIVQSEGGLRSGYSYIGRPGGNVERQGQEIIFSGGNVVESITVEMYKRNAPTGKVICNVYEEDKVTLIGSSINTFGADDMQDSVFEPFQFVFDTMYIDSDRTLFFEFMLYGGSEDSRNYYAISAGSNANLYAGKHHYYTGTWYTGGDGGDIKFDVQIGNGDISEISDMPGDTPVKVGHAISETEMLILIQHPNEVSNTGSYNSLGGTWSNNGTVTYETGTIKTTTLAKVELGGLYNSGSSDVATVYEIDSNGIETIVLSGIGENEVEATIILNSGKNYKLVLQSEGQNGGARGYLKYLN